MHVSLAGYPVILDIPVLWGDQDAFQHVNNIVYLRWSETARIDYITRVGLSRLLQEQQVGPIVASISCNYRIPVTYPDRILVGARVSRIGNSSFQMDHTIVSIAYNAVAADLTSTLVVFDYKSNSPVRVPDPVRDAIAELERTAPLAAG